MRNATGTAQGRTIRYSADNKAYAMMRGATSAPLQTIVGTTTTSRYLFHDQLGSVARITDAAGVVQASLDYIPAGARRSMSDPMQVEEDSPALSDRGFTGHEHLDGVGVIHMNGRIYDPGLGRFLQPDPFVQAPGSAQSWNAYTYVFNNPLRYTDPTGMLGQSERGWLGAIIMLAAAVTQQYWAAGFTGTYGAAMTAGVYAGVGFVSGAVATQSWRGGLMGAMTALITAGVGIATVDGGVAGWGVRTFTGGVTESLRGGNFGHAFASAGLSAAFMPQRGQIPNPVARTLTGAIVGGTISRATGGKFANGAVTGAIQAAMMDGGSRGGESALTPEQEASFAEQAAYNYEIALAFEPPSLPQGLVDGVAGFGDTISFGGTKAYREWRGIGSVNYGSGAYTAGEVAGVAYGFAAGGVGGLSGGARSVFWSGTGNMERAAAMGRSLERTPIGSVMNRFGDRVPYWGWKAASCIYACNASGTAIKVGTQQGTIWRTIEQPILQWRSVPIKTVP